MISIDLEWDGIEALYQAFESRLDKQFQDLLANRFPSAEEESEASRLDGFILEAEKTLTRLASNGCNHALSSCQEEDPFAIRASSLRKRANHLLELIERNAAQCRQLQSAARSALQELQRGGQFLHSVRGYRENQPRFVDSRQ
jgi:hypothetical protein